MSTSSTDHANTVGNISTLCVPPAASVCSLGVPPLPAPTVGGSDDPRSMQKSPTPTFCPATLQPPGRAVAERASVAAMTCLLLQLVAIGRISCDPHTEITTHGQRDPAAECHGGSAHWKLLLSCKVVRPSNSNSQLWISNLAITSWANRCIRHGSSSISISSIPTHPLSYSTAPHLSLHSCQLPPLVTISLLPCMELS